MTLPSERFSPTWPEVRFRHLAEVRKGRLPSSANGAALNSEKAAYLTMEYLRGEEVIAPSLVSVEPDLLLADDDDILLLWDGSNAGEFLRAKRGVVSSTTALVTPKSVDPAFFFWACKAQEDRVRAETVGMGIPHVDGDFLANLRIQLPNLNQQRTIAEYLDQETARLDGLVLEKKRILELLTEKRRVLITNAVTRGLDPRSPVYDSGISWLGPLPSHWSRIRLRHLACFITSGSRDWAQYYSDSGSLFIRIGNLTRNSIHLDLTDIQYVDPTKDSECERTKIQPGDILLSITAYLGSIAVAPVGLDNAYINQHIALVRLTNTKEIDPIYIGYTLLSEIGQSQIVKQGYGGTKTQLSLKDIRDIWLPMPPLLEQIAIVKEIRRKTSVIDVLYSATVRIINLLKERRTALIRAAIADQINLGRTS